MHSDIILIPQRLTRPNTKVRRLGYFVAILSIIQDKEVPINILEKEILEWSNNNELALKQYSSSLPVCRRRKEKIVGEIRTLDAARRYINTCLELGLLAKIRGYIVSKMGRVLIALPFDGNPFKLSIGRTFIILKSTQLESNSKI